MRVPGPFEIERVIEFEWPGRDPQFLLKDVTAEQFRATRTADDARFVTQDTKQLIMSFHSYLLKTPGGTLLVDACVGNHKERPALAEWHMRDGPYLERLAAAGVTPEEISFVCCTHLHADHVGWNTQLKDGRWVPTFPNARYLFAETEVAHWEQFHAADPDNRYRRSWEDSVLPVLEAGQVDRVASDAELLHGIRLRPAPGHTPGNVVIEADDGRKRAVLCGDTIHHPVQIENPHWSSNFCADPVQSAVSRRALIERLADTDTILLPAHFATPTAVTIVSEGEGFFYANPRA